MTQPIGHRGADIGLNKVLSFHVNLMVIYAHKTYIKIFILKENNNKSIKIKTRVQHQMTFSI